MFKSCRKVIFIFSCIAFVGGCSTVEKGMKGFENFISLAFSDIKSLLDGGNEGAGVTKSRIKGGHTYTFDDAILFDFGQSSLKPQVKSVLDEFAADALRSDKNIFIAGYTDNVGTFERNLSLSKKRANSVARYLNAKGLKNKRIYKSGYGYLFPLEPNTSDKSRAKNRRVEISLVNKNATNYHLEQKRSRELQVASVISKRKSDFDKSAIMKGVSVKWSQNIIVETQNCQVTLFRRCEKISYPISYSGEVVGVDNTTGQYQIKVRKAKLKDDSSPKKAIYYQNQSLAIGKASKLINTNAAVDFESVSKDL